MRSRTDWQSRGRFNSNRPRPQPRAPQHNQIFDSTGPNVKLRGDAYRIFERYVTLAREAWTSGDRIAAENFYQHAEHYFRINNARREDGQQGTPPRSTAPRDIEVNSSAADTSEGEADVDQSQSQWDGDDKISLETFN
jgi:hypothetical protein